MGMPVMEYLMVRNRGRRKEKGKGRWYEEAQTAVSDRECSERPTLVRESRSKSKVGKELTGDCLDTQDERGVSAGSEGECGGGKATVGEESTRNLMLNTSEVKSEARGRRLHKLKLMSGLGKGECEVMETSGNVCWVTDGRTQDNEAVIKKMATAVSISCPS
jgi:hypothetical protein